MASRIVWWVLTLGILAVIHLPVTKGRCVIGEQCIACKRAKATKDHCIEDLICFNRVPWNHVCLKYEGEKQICGIKPVVCQGLSGSCVFPVGGWKMNEGKWPWQVSLQSILDVHICGGVLIDNDWVLTAANCVYKTNARDWMVVLGEFDLKRKTGEEQFHRIKHIFVHPNYHPIGYTNDVALIKLEKDARYNEYVSPICLPSFNDIYSLKSCVITGWGKPRGTGDNSRLRVLKVTVSSPDVCKTIHRLIRPKHHICVNYGPKGASFHDAGGPLSCVRSSGGRFIVEGVASWVDKTYQHSDQPSVYTNIRTFVPWINTIMNSTKGKP